MKFFFIQGNTEKKFCVKRNLTNKIIFFSEQKCIKIRIVNRERNFLWKIDISFYEKEKSTRIFRIIDTP